MLDLQTLIDHFRYNELFTPFPAPIRNSLFHSAKMQHARAGETIYRTGEAGDWFGALLSGRVRICLRSQEGKEVLVSLIERGRTFGETSVLDGLPRPVDAVAETDVSYLIIKRDEIMPVLLQYPKVMEAMLKVLCHRTRIYLQKMELFALQGLPTRLAFHLLRLARKYGQEENGRMVVRAGLSQGDLAQQLAISRESINKQLKLFAEQNLVELKGHDIALLDIAALEAIACPSPAPDEKAA
jgi:CRP-like cAMP-binding protein